MTDGVAINQCGSVIHFSIERLEDDAEAFRHVPLFPKRRCFASSFGNSAENDCFLYAVFCAMVTLWFTQPH